MQLNQAKTISLHPRGNTQMLYFTCSSLSADDGKIF